jgi:hypothetical protein
MNEMNDVLNKERKKPKAARVQRTFDVPLDWQNAEELLRKEEELLRREAYAGWSQAQLCREAWAEYVTRHHPGNPTPPLEAYPPFNQPFSEAAREKMEIQGGADLPRKILTLPELEAMTSENLEALYKRSDVTGSDRSFIAYVLHKRWYHVLGDCYCGRFHQDRNDASDPR